MSMKKWTDDELLSTRDKLQSWSQRNSNQGSKMWLFTALLGAFAISTGVVFIFFDGVDALSIVLIVMGTITCISWYKSEKQRKDNQEFLQEINREIKSRKLKDDKSTKKANDSIANETLNANLTNDSHNESEQAEKFSSK